MSWIDLVCLVVIGLGAFRGFRSGLIHSVVSLVGVIVSIYAAARYYAPVAAWLTEHTAWAPNQSSFVVFVAAFFLLLFGLKLAFWLFERSIAIIHVLPLMKTTDRILGLVFGALSGGFALGAVVYMLERFPLGSFVMTPLASSVLVPYVSLLANVLVPLLPDALRVLQSSVDYVGNKVGQ